MVNDKQTILIDRQGRVGLITLNRPDYLNAVNSTMGLEIREQIEEFNEDDSIGSIVMTGAGRAFSAGADVSGFEATVKGDKIYINNKETSEYTFKQNYYWLMGDNRGNSQDSRYWGFVPKKDILGKALFTFWPISRMRMLL